MLGFSERVLWIFGLPASGKTTAAIGLRNHLQTEGWTALVLDEETLNAGSAPVADADQSSEVRRTAELAKSLADQGSIVIVTMATRKEKHRLLAREIIGESLFLIQLNCTRALREERTLSDGPLPEDGVFEPSEFGSHMISTDKITGAQTAQLILKLLRLWQEHPANVATSLVDKPVLRRILPRGQGEQGVSQSGGASVPSQEWQSGQPYLEKGRSRAAQVERVTPSGSVMRNYQPEVESQPHSQPRQQEERPAPQAAGPRESPSISWRGTVETGAAKDADTEGAGATTGGHGSRRSGRRRPRRFVENQSLVWSPMSLIILTICAGIAFTVIVWVIDTSLKKKEDKERLLEGVAPSADIKAKPVDIPSPTDAMTKKRNAAAAGR